ncbi:MAG: aminoglycoside phosphotransferase family protein [Bacillota bacterium]
MVATPKESAPDPRAASAYVWALAQVNLTSASFAPASADASFRRYFRLESGGESWILMDAPPDKENCEPFLHVDKLLLDAGLHAPIVHAQNLKRGFLLLSDLGRRTYLNVLDENNADRMFADAIDALIKWQLASRVNELPAYDDALLRREIRLFPDWYVAKHLKRELTPAQRSAWQSMEDLLIGRALAQSRVYVHRDYMPRNLMVSTPNPGILDFQDAVYGPISYDIVCLFRDAFLSWPEERVREWRKRYWDAARAAHLPVPSSYGEFVRDFDLMGVQRHLKVLGIFARINYRDGKPHYLKDTPRFIRYVRDVAIQYDELKPLLKLFDEMGLQ